MNDLLAQIADLSPEKRQLLLQRMQQKQGTVPQQQILPQPRHGNIVPVSYSQQQLWLLDQIEPGNPAFHIAASVYLRGKLDRRALEWSINQIIRRHESLRTTFDGAREDRTPAQVIAAELSVPLSAIDLQVFPRGERHALARRMSDEDAARPFDLRRGPLVRATLFCVDPHEHLLALTMHHIIADGWSLGIFIRELTLLYPAAIAGAEDAATSGIALPDLPIQYADYALWQRASIAGAHLDEQLRYWTRQLADAPPILELPTDHPRPPMQTFRGARQSSLLPPALTTALTALSQREGATLFMTLLAAFQILLARYTGQDDIVVGSPIAGRNRVETERVIGCFVNTLVLRTNLSGSPGFREVVQRVRNVCLEAYAHQELPFEKLLEHLQPDRALSHTPLFQVFFNMLNLPDSVIELPGLTVETVASDELGAKFDLTLYVQEQAGGIALNLVYNAELFGPARMAALLQQFEQLLTHAVEQPDTPIAAFSLVTPGMRRVLPDPTIPLDPTWEGAVHTLFAEHARRVGAALAVVDRETTWTYDALDRRSNQLANALLARGMQRGDVVAIYAHRSAALVWALLGVLKAGAAFTMLDPAYPPARLVDYLRVAQPRALIQLEAAGELPEALAAFVSTLGCWTLTLPERAEMAHALLACSEDDPAVVVGPDDIACIGFTSGSTGLPKGILGRHGPLTHFLPWQRQAFGLNAEDRFCLLSGLALDLLQREIFTPLCIGAAVYIPDSSDIATPGQLARWMQQHAISLIYVTPAMAQLLTERPQGLGAAQPTLSALRYAFIGGDMLTRQDIARLRAIAPTATVINSYGATETQRAVAWYVVPGEERPEALRERSKETLPVGQGIPDVQLLIVNQAGSLAAIGEVGEIHFRSPHLAKGYLGNDALTQERFIANPFTGQADDRLYKTGDLGRYLPDGTIELLGRADHQVKIRGFRIELGEIEAVLSQHPAVDDRVVLAREDLRGEKRLVAYVVPRKEPGALWAHKEADSEESCSLFSVLDSAALRQHVGARLPAYMVPSAFVLLDALPVTPNGKLDRKALPVPDWSRSDLADSFIAPRTPLEAEVAAIWADVLKLDRVGIHDNFFTLGGHSLLAVQLVARLRDRFGVELPLRSLFEMPTVAELAAAIAQRTAEHQAAAPATSQIPAIQPDRARRYEPFPLTDIQQAYWIGRSAAMELGNIATHIYLEVESDALDLARLAHAWRRLIERHDMLRAIVLPDGRQQILEQVPPYEIEMLDLRPHEASVRAAQLDAVRQQMSHAVLRPDRWPLFEICASQIDDTQIRLHISIDMLIADAWSLRLLIGELAQLYRDPQRVFAPLELSFRDYVLAERVLHDSEQYRTAQEYWRRRLPLLPPPPELPLAKQPGTIAQPRFVRRSSRLEPDRWQRIKDRATRAGLTASAVLLGAFADMLATWSKTPRFTINLTLFHRLPLHPQVNDLVGDFTSVTLLGIDHGSALPFEERTRQIQQQLWDDLEHRAVSGVAVLRERAHSQGDVLSTAMPVVFTSTLNLMQPAQEASQVQTFGNVVYSSGQTSQVWLDHQVTEDRGALVFNWDSVDELFPADLIQEMFDAYCGLLHQLVDDEARWQATARQLVPPAQLAQRAAINMTDAPVSDALLHTLFVEQVHLRPDQPAVIAPGRTLSYQELDRRAQQIGQQLRAHDVRPNTLVAVVMEKGWEQVVAVLGVLQAGAAYLPIDPSLPQERLWHLLDHGQAAIVLTQSWIEQRLTWPPNLQRIPVDRQPPASPDFVPSPAAQQPDDLAYVIYTSGSTGLPKGVMIDHRGAVNTILDINRRFQVNARDRVLALSSLSFDLSVYDIFGTLAAGATIVMPDARSALDPSHWAEVAVREHVTIWNSVPALMELLVEYVAERPALLPHDLRLALLSGDWIPVSLPEQIKTLLGGTQVISLGGATEASIWSIGYPIEQVDPAWKSIPYGRPLANQQFHVLDEQLEPCPTWVPGQLYIGGIGLAQGYWRDPEKTAARFITHPLSGDGLYWTGDLGRYLPDGTIEFLGREDFQVKIQGYRIELGEIEAALLEYPGVRSAVVTATGERHGNKRLVAYVVVEQGNKRTGEGLTASIRAHLKDRLPTYMVPSAVVVLDALPL
ncbi:MAG TPA: amino acid adenylation domain-containing protein, partial [Herpetosiphonaceae bacterium]